MGIKQQNSLTLSQYLWSKHGSGRVLFPFAEPFYTYKWQRNPNRNTHNIHIVRPVRCLYLAWIYRTSETTYAGLISAATQSVCWQVAVAVPRLKLRFRVTGVGLKAVMAAFGVSNSVSSLQMSLAGRIEHIDQPEVKTVGRRDWVHQRSLDWTSQSGTLYANLEF